MVDSTNLVDSVIVGGGVAGLATAYELSKHRDIRLLLIEKSKLYTGGRISREKLEDFYLDRGAIFMFNPQSVKNYLRELKFSGRDIRVYKKILYYYNSGNLYKINFGSIIRGMRDLLNSKLLKLGDLFGIDSVNLYLKSYLLYRKAIKNFNSLRLCQDIDSSERLNRILKGNGEINRILSALTEAFFLSDLHHLSNIALLCLIGTFIYSSNFMYLKGGIGRLTECLLSKISNQSNVTVIRDTVSEIRREGDIFVVKCVSNLEIKSKSVVIAVPPPEFKNVISSELFEECRCLRQLSKLEYLPAVVAYVGVKSRTRVDNKLIIPLDSEIKRIAFVGDVTDKCYEKDIQSEDVSRIIYVLISPKYANKLMDEQNHAIIEEIYNELFSISNIKTESIVWVKVYKWKHALPKLTKSYFSEDISPRTEINGLFIVGDSISVGVESIISTAKTVATMVADFLNK